MYRILSLGRLHVRVKTIRQQRTYHVLSQRLPLAVCEQEKETWRNQGRRHFTKDFYETYLSSSSPPIGFAQSLLEQSHDLTGLPWWASLIITTITLRTAVTLPVAVYSMKNMDKIARLQPELAALSQELKQEVIRAVKEFNWEYKTARFKYNSTMKKLIKERYIRDNCHPFKSTLVVLIQLPLWFTMSFALRNMSGYVPMHGAGDVIPVPSLATEGILWFSNLAVPDSTWILPLILGGLNLALVEMNAYRMQNPTNSQKLITNVFRFLSVLMVPVGATVPSCMCLYWTTSSLYGLVQNMALKRPEIREKLGLSVGHTANANVSTKLDDSEMKSR